MAENLFVNWYSGNSERIDWLLGETPWVVPEAWQLMHPRISPKFSTYQPRLTHLPSTIRQNLYGLEIRLVDIKDIHAYVRIGSKEYLRKIKKVHVETTATIILPDGKFRNITIPSYLGRREKVIVGDFPGQTFIDLPADIPVFEVLAVEDNFAFIGPPIHLDEE